MLEYYDENGKYPKFCESSIDDWKKTWMAKGNKCIFISAVEKDNYQEFRDLLYQEIRDMHAIRYPYDNFLY